MSTWREVLTLDEKSDLEMIEEEQAWMREKLQQLSKFKRSIMNRAIQRKKYQSHPKMGVDMSGKHA